MNTRHTPGPWRLSRSGDEQRTIVQERANASMVICILAQPDCGDEEANARLIASAPELLVALIDAVHVAVEARNGNFQPNRLDYFIEQAEATIKKAKGEA